MQKSHFMRLSVISCFVSGLALAAAPSPAQAESVQAGVNAAIKGNVTIQSVDQTAKEAVLREPVFMGDLVNSQKLSSLQVLLLDQTVLTVGPSCDMVIDEFVYDPTKNNNSLKLRVKRGLFRFTSGKTSESGRDAVKVDTPVATIGIRGTIVEGMIGPDAVAFAQQIGVAAASGNIDNDGASLLVLRGPGSKHRTKNKRGLLDVTSGGETVTLSQSGMAVFVPHKDAPPSDPFLLPDVLFAYFSDQLRTQPSSGPGYKSFDVLARYNTLPQIRPDCRGDECSKDIFEPLRGMPFPHGFEGVICNSDGGCNPNPNEDYDPYDDNPNSQ